MDLDFGHGFLPRVGEGNYKAADRCVGPADLFTPDPLDLPWAIIDGAWAEGRPDLLGTLRQHGTKLLIDTYGWRYRYASTVNVAKLRDASWSPGTSLSVTDTTAGRQLVEGSLRAQATLGADAYFLPGWLPESGTEDLRGPYQQIIETAGRFDDVPARPFVLFVGGHTKGLEQVASLLDEVPHFISTLYVQISPIAPAKDSPSKLEAMTRIYQQVAERGFKVIAGHSGAISPALRSLGIDAADAGLADGETFDRTRAKSSSKKDSKDEGKGGGRRSRMYFSQIDRSLDASEVERLLSIPGAAAELRTCRLPCHRFRADHLLDQAREHSLWTRVAEAQLVSSLPTSMRPRYPDLLESTHHSRRELPPALGTRQVDANEPACETTFRRSKAGRVRVRGS